MTAHSELVARLEGASEVLRESADAKSWSYKSGGGTVTVRDNVADATADLAEAVLFILRAKEPQPDGEKT